MTQRLSDRRNALITAGGIAAVMVAGAFAVGANVGILDASSDNKIGALAAGDLVPTTGATPAPVITAPATAATTVPQTFLVDVAGTVAVDPTGDALVVSTVGSSPGWTWAPGPSDASHIELTFTDGVRSLVFTATRATDGSVDASVHETTSGMPTATTTTNSHGDDDEHGDDEHEGRDDDD